MREPKKLGTLLTMKPLKKEISFFPVSMSFINELSQFFCGEKVSFVDFLFANDSFFSIFFLFSVSFLFYFLRSSFHSRHRHKLLFPSRQPGVFPLITRIVCSVVVPCDKGLQFPLERALSCNTSSHGRRDKCEVLETEQ